MWAYSHHKNKKQKVKEASKTLSSGDGRKMSTLLDNKVLCSWEQTQPHFRGDGRLPHISIEPFLNTLPLHFPSCILIWMSFDPYRYFTFFLHDVRSELHLLPTRDTTLVRFLVPLLYIKKTSQIGLWGVDYCFDPNGIYRIFLIFFWLFLRAVDSTFFWPLLRIVISPCFGNHQSTHSVPFRRRLSLQRSSMDATLPAAFFYFVTNTCVFARFFLSSSARCLIEKNALRF